MNTKRKIFSLLISLYPKSYKEHFGESLLQTFDDMQCDDDMSELFILRDTALSIPMQYINYFEETMQTKFKNLPAAISGAILVLPFTLLFVASIFAQFLRDVGLPNSLNDEIGHTIGVNSGHWSIGIAILFVFPILAFVINLIALGWAGYKERDIPVRKFIFGNIFSIIVLFIGIGVALFVPFHDALPCFVNGAFRGGLSNFPQLMRMCSNA